MEAERDERALAALREHEDQCAARYERYAERFTSLEGAVKALTDKVSGNTKTLWWFGTAIFSGVVLVNIKEWFA